MRHQRLLGVDGAAGQSRQAAQLHPRQAGLAQLLAAQVGLDQVDLVVDALLHGGAVPPPLPELILALVYGPHRPQSHRVHEARIPLAKLHLKIKSIRNVSQPIDCGCQKSGPRKMNGMSINLDNQLISIKSIWSFFLNLKFEIFQFGW